MITKLFLTTFLFSLGSIISVIKSSDVFKSSELYIFYTGVSISAFLLSIVGCIVNLHAFPYVVQNEEREFAYELFMFTLPSFVYTLSWSICSLGSAIYLKRCRDSNSDSDSCNGEIISTVFGFLNLLVWMFVMYYISVDRWFEKYKLYKLEKLQKKMLILEQRMKIDEINEVSEVNSRQTV